MARYIDADELYKDTERRINEANSYRMAVVDDEFLDLIKDAETADVVEVVRCKDCIHAKPFMHRGEIMEDIYRCSYLKPNTNMFDIDYCRYGKRRIYEEGEKNHDR